MVPTTKEAQRAELHKTIWRIANDLRGSVDGWDFKSYVLGMLFYQFTSENFTSSINAGEHKAGDADFNDATLLDAQAEFGGKETVEEKGFYILPSATFANARQRAHEDANLNEAIVSNSPYSITWDGDSNPLLIYDARFAPAAVLAPKSEAELAFTMHILAWLAVNGTVAIVEFPGVLYRGGAERKIRKQLIDNNYYVDAVIQLLPDLFIGTTTATCIIVLKKSKNDNTVLFIDASAEFKRGGNKNKLTETNQHTVLDAFTKREDAELFAKLVANEYIAVNDFNLAVSPYGEQSETREVVDITESNAEIDWIVACQHELRTSIDAIVVDLERVGP